MGTIIWNTYCTVAISTLEYYSTLAVLGTRVQFKVRFYQGAINSKGTILPWKFLGRVLFEVVYYSKMGINCVSTVHWPPKLVEEPCWRNLYLTFHKGIPLQFRMPSYIRYLVYLTSLKIPHPKDKKKTFLDQIRNTISVSFWLLT